MLQFSLTSKSSLLFVCPLFLRHIHEPEVIESGHSSENEAEMRRGRESSEEEEEEELSDTEIERRRQMLKQRVLTLKEQMV